MTEDKDKKQEQKMKLNHLNTGREDYRTRKPIIDENPDRFIPVPRKIKKKPRRFW